MILLCYEYLVSVRMTSLPTLFRINNSWSKMWKKERHIGITGYYSLFFTQITF